MYSANGVLHNSFVVKKAYDSLWDDLMENYQLTRVEIDVLAFIANNPEMDTAHDIVNYRMIAKSHVSKAVESLLSRGFLVREQDRKDRRCMHLTLTESAGEVVDAILTKQTEFTRKIAEGFTEDELAFFAKMTRRVAVNASKLL